MHYASVCVGSVPLLGMLLALKNFPFGQNEQDKVVQITDIGIFILEQLSLLNSPPFVSPFLANQGQRTAGTKSKEQRENVFLCCFERNPIMTPMLIPAPAATPHHTAS